MAGGKTLIAVVVAVFSAVFGWAEWKTWRASREALPAGATDPSRIEPGESVLVLGNPVPIVQRWRVRIAVRSTDPDRARFVFSGAAVRGQIPEAQMMADYAVQELGVPLHNVVVEDQSRTTVENVVNSAPLMADSPAIKIASNTFHARRAPNPSCRITGIGRTFGTNTGLHSSRVGTTARGAGGLRGLPGSSCTLGSPGLGVATVLSPTVEGRPIGAFASCSMTASLARLLIRWPLGFRGMWPSGETREIRRFCHGGTGQILRTDCGLL